ncbi:MAG: two-component regulator propeller domain-containing protein, partial [Bacteroidota bacterium]
KSYFTKDKTTRDGFYSTTHEYNGIEIKSRPISFLYYASDSALNEQQIIYDKITAIEPIDSQSVWVGTMNGIYEIRRNKKGNLQCEQLPLLSTVRISEILSTPGGTIYVSTIGEGLLVIENDQITHRIKAKLSSDLVNCLALDTEQNLWLGTNKGLDQIKLPLGSESTVRHFTGADGLSSDYIHDIQILDSSIIVALDNGINVFEAKDWKRKITVPKLQYLEAHEVLNNGRIFNNSTLKHRHNSLRFDFKAISQSRPAHLPFYRYRLIDQDNLPPNEWYYTNSTEILLANILAGKYIFELAARNKNEEWSTTHALAFEIKPKWTSTIYFKFLIALLTATIIFPIWYFNLQRRREKEKAISAAHKTKVAELNAL